jgi:hypothetical protein
LAGQNDQRDFRDIPSYFIGFSAVIAINASDKIQGAQSQSRVHLEMRITDDRYIPLGQRFPNNMFTLAVPKINKNLQFEIFSDCI